MKILVCGGREWDRAVRVLVYKMLDRVYLKQNGNIEIIDGDAPGVDTYASEWAGERGVNLTRFPANWHKHGRAAGPIRNKQMLDEGKPDLVLAFPGGRGTTNMVEQARAAGVRVEEVS